MGLFMSAEQGRDRIRSALDAIDAAHEVLRRTPWEVVGNAFRVDFADRLESQNRLNRGLMYRVFGEIADPRDEAGCVPAVRGMLWARLRIPPREVMRRFRLAARLRPRRSLTGAPLEPELPALAQAVAAGAVGEDHIRAVCAAVDTLPSGVSPVDVADAERTLVRHATKLDAAVVSTLGRRIADYLNPDGRFTEADRARRRGVHLSQQGPDGMSRLTGLLDPEARCYFEALEAAVRPGRHQSPDSDPEARDHRTPAQRHHDALTRTRDRHRLRRSRDAPRASRHRGRHHYVDRTRPGRARCGRLVNPDADAGTDRRRFAAADAGPDSDGRQSSSLPGRVRRAHRPPVVSGPAETHRQRGSTLICYARDRGCTHPICLEPGYHCEVHHAQE
jgi:hypothetical protein